MFMRAGMSQWTMLELGKVRSQTSQHSAVTLIVFAPAAGVNEDPVTGSAGSFELPFFAVRPGKSLPPGDPAQAATTVSTMLPAPTDTLNFLPASMASPFTVAKDPETDPNVMIVKLSPRLGT